MRIQLHLKDRDRRRLDVAEVDLAQGQTQPRQKVRRRRQGLARAVPDQKVEVRGQVVAPTKKVRLL